MADRTSDPVTNFFSVCSAVGWSDYCVFLPVVWCVMILIGTKIVKIKFHTMLM